MTLHSNLIASMGEPNAARAWRRAILFRERLERSLEAEKLAHNLFQMERRRNSEITNFAFAQAADVSDLLEFADEDAARASHWFAAFVFNFGLTLIAAWARLLEVAQ